jgi:hypothetical protein
LIFWLLRLWMTSSLRRMMMSCLSYCSTSLS